MSIDLNADVGEGHNDLPIFPLVTSVNVACGAHAGDEATMDRSVAEAVRLGVAVGAHPGYPDREGYGRRPLTIGHGELRDSLIEQIRLLASIAVRHGARLKHVKPHGALYNQAADDAKFSAVVAEAVRAADPSLRVVGLAGSMMSAGATEFGLKFTAEAFADRRYLVNGRLVSRADPRALILDAGEAAAHAVALATGEPVATLDGGVLRVSAQTICVHGDTPGAVEIARATGQALEGAGISLRALGED